MVMRGLEELSAKFYNRFSHSKVSATPSYGSTTSLQPATASVDDADSPNFSQNSFYGRVRHFASITDPRLVFTPNTELFKAKELLGAVRQGNSEASPSEIRRAKVLYGSAFHPDSGELQNVMGRMCFNVYGSTLMCGGMMVFYRSTAGVFFWQWANQSFNALVNYTNRNAKSPLTKKDLLTAYTSAVSGALGVAFGLKWFCAYKKLSVAWQRLVPISAVCVANFINIPLMRQNELKYGMTVSDAEGNEVGKSKTAAFKAIGQVAFSRNIIVIPSMVLTPMIVDVAAARWKWFGKNLKVLNIPAQLGLIFVLFGAMVPVGCGLFPQQSSISVESLKRFEPETYESLRTRGLDTVYFNKGL
ncbi:unnamed protein product [Bursaphelenchus okinawaensis]|uniref:Sidoreflexin n=1 Tax=Bursaphelenchus okinawaensis TaxID=465554 RepID=A0A811KMN7_9BILA|nr:unnamed protein product [Bursaphelenchus okinawaensis]CAG9105363.1 unnamed protein product [Bursaphelenchus okinawaensis]